jgi:hypothetical protein
MKEQPDVKIIIEYQLTDNKKWESVELTPDKYFDFEPDEKIDLNSVPKYNHAIEYLGSDHHRVGITKLLIIEEASQTKRSIIETFWNKGENRLIERFDSEPNPYWEMILEIKVSEVPPVWEILRLGKKDGVMTPWYHAFLQDNDDGSQTENRIDVG